MAAVTLHSVPGRAGEPDREEERTITMVNTYQPPARRETPGRRRIVCRSRRLRRSRRRARRGDIRLAWQQVDVVLNHLEATGCRRQPFSPPRSSHRAATAAAGDGDARAGRGLRGRDATGPRADIRRGAGGRARGGAAAQPPGGAQRDAGALP